MKFLASLTFLSTLLATAFASNPQTQSPPFRLRITSNSTSNTVHYAVPFRTGAMTFKLTLTDKSDLATTWRLNTTTAPLDFGYLITTAPYKTDRNTTTLSFAVTVSPRVGSNVAVLTFAPRTENDQPQLTMFGIDSNKMLTVDGGDDDTDGQVLPPKWLGSLRRWYTCKAQGVPGHKSQKGDIDVLAWVMGSEKPEDPSCLKIDIGLEMI